MLKYLNAILKTYTGEKIKDLVSIDVNMTYQNERRQLPVLEVSGYGPSLIGQNWLQ